MNIHLRQTVHPSFSTKYFSIKSLKNGILLCKDIINALCANRLIIKHICHHSPIQLWNLGLLFHKCSMKYTLINIRTLNVCKGHLAQFIFVKHIPNWINWNIWHVSLHSNLVCAQYIFYWIGLPNISYNRFAIVVKKSLVIKHHFGNNCLRTIVFTEHRISIGINTRITPI